MQEEETFSKKVSSSYLFSQDKISKLKSGRKVDAGGLVFAVSKLFGIEFGINTAEGHEGIVGALLGDLAPCDDGDFVCIFNGGKSMCHHQGGTATAKLVEGFLDQNFGGVVKRTGGFVQNQNGWIVEEYACNAEALFLPT